MRIIITIAELIMIEKEINETESLFNCESINDYELSLSFDSLKKALLFDEILKDRLVLKGFDDDYNLNSFGEMCERLIDKMSEMLK